MQTPSATEDICDEWIDELMDGDDLDRTDYWEKKMLRYENGWVTITPLLPMVAQKLWAKGRHP